MDGRTSYETSVVGYGKPDLWNKETKSHKHRACLFGVCDRVKLPKQIIAEIIKGSVISNTFTWMRITLGLRNCLWSTRRAKFAASPRGLWVGVCGADHFITLTPCTQGMSDLTTHPIFYSTLLSLGPLLQPTSSGSSMQRSLEKISCWRSRSDITNSLEYNVCTDPDPQDLIWSCILLKKE